ncbi:MAG: hypothetical protein IJX93_04710 [Clostridia bacterium]|nr:hypothetical protein [Clostridia bacterium]MBQ8333055.1 hypothetical protein [Clostridia bacterium]MBQ8370984.1 hypothetical protein [Clostridia bacterium]MBQ8511580.1 hypothetical protein [Clostridia bacterium]
MSDTTNTVNEGVELLLSLIFPINADTMTAEKWSAVEKAAQIQAEFDASRTGTPVKSRSVGDVSVTYAESAQNACITVGGHPIAPEALAILKNEGLLCRWV